NSRISVAVQARRFFALFAILASAFHRKCDRPVLVYMHEQAEGNLSQRRAKVGEKGRGNVFARPAARTDERFRELTAWHARQWREEEPARRRGREQMRDDH